MSNPQKRAFYFGCWDRVGHYLHDHKGRSVNEFSNAGDSVWKTYGQALPDITIPWNTGHMDSGLLTNGKHRDVVDGKVFWTCGGRDDLWYAFVWWDRSVDQRGASNSGFYVQGFGPEDLTPDTAKANAKLAFEYACGVFPKIVARQFAPLVLQLEK